MFPCNHCSRRGVAHLCRFVSKTVNKTESQTDGQSAKLVLIIAPDFDFVFADRYFRLPRLSKKRDIDSIDGGAPEDALYEDAEPAGFNASDALNALGYMPHAHHLVLGNGSGPKVMSLSFKMKLFPNKLLCRWVGIPWEWTRDLLNPKSSRLPCCPCHQSPTQVRFPLYSFSAMCSQGNRLSRG